METPQWCCVAVLRTNSLGDEHRVVLWCCPITIVAVAHDKGQVTPQQWLAMA